MIEIPYSQNYAINKDLPRDPDLQPCAICGKPVSKPRWWVHVHMGGVFLVTDEEAAELDNAADLGWYPVGLDCFRKHPEIRDYAYRGSTEGLENEA